MGKVDRLNEKPVVLLVGGGPRCGTTLLVDLLNENRRIGVLSEYVFDDLLRTLVPLFERERVIAEMALPSQGDETADAPTGSECQLASFQFRQNLSLNYPRRFPTKADLPAALSILTGLFLGKKPLAVVGAKDPFFTLHHSRRFVDRHLGLPIRYILLLRSPFGQINSSLNRRNLVDAGRDIWHVRTVEDAIHEYRSMCMLNYSYLVHFGTEALLIKYEDLVSDPSGTLRQVYRLIGMAGRPEIGGVTFDHDPVDILTESEKAAVNDAFGHLQREWDERIITASADISGAFKGLLERYPRPFELSLHPATRGRPLLGLGWQEGFSPDGARSRDDCAYLVFSVDTEVAVGIQLTVAPIFGPNNDVIECTVSLDGQTLCDLRWHRGGALSPLTVIPTSRSRTLTVLVGSEPRTIEVGRESLIADVPHTIRLSFSCDGGVALSRFSLA